MSKVNGSNPIQVQQTRLIVLVGGFLVAFAFLFLDPEPSLLLSASMGINTGLMLWILIKLYEMELLLSPISAVVLGSGYKGGFFFFYSLGNLGPRIIGETRYLAIIGSLDYYPISAALSTIGLIVFSWLIFGPLKRFVTTYRIHYRDLEWQPWQALIACGVAVLNMAYLSSKYVFISGYFKNLEGTLDRALASANNFFILLALIIASSVFIKNRTQLGRLIGIMGITFIMAIALVLRSRTYMVMLVVQVAMCWITLRPHFVKRILVLTSSLGLLMLVIGSYVKQETMVVSSNSIEQNIRLILSADLRGVRSAAQFFLTQDGEYRLAGLELPSVILQAYARGARPMYGEAMLGGILQSLPSFLRPAGIHTERFYIYWHFKNYGLNTDEAISIPLASGLADWGALGAPFIYFVVALYCVVLWNIVQRSPRLFLAFLMAGLSPGDLFWEGGLYAIRAVGFSWLALFTFARIVMPVWKQPAPSHVEENILDAQSVSVPVTVIQSQPISNVKKF